jgi:hypothetical protein
MVLCVLRGQDFQDQRRELHRHGVRGRRRQAQGCSATDGTGPLPCSCRVGLAPRVTCGAVFPAGIALPWRLPGATSDHLGRATARCGCGCGCRCWLRRWWRRRGVATHVLRLQLVQCRRRPCAWSRRAAGVGPPHVLRLELQLVERRARCSTRAGVPTRADARACGRAPCRRGCSARSGARPRRRRRRLVVDRRGTGVAVLKYR